MLKLSAPPQPITFGSNRRVLIVIVLIALLTMVVIASANEALVASAPSASLSLLPESVPLNLATSSVSSPSIAPYAGDDRICGPDVGGNAQTAALYFTGDASSSILMYELNDNGVGTYLGEVSNADVDAALQAAEAAGQPVSFFSASTYNVVGLPNGLCQFTSVQIPTSEGKPFTCTFTCNG